ncbi:MAG: HAMP domain-containing protein [Candidatus Hydrogenedens sp.]|nr:HAMP domain-containing protein [Candidatus Hydrogenedens sp.]
MPESSSTVAVFPPPRRVRWHQSLLFRVLLLCAVLLLCLLAAVGMISRYFFQEAAREMRMQTEQIVDSLVLGYETAPATDLESMAAELMQQYKGVEIELQSPESDTPVATYTLEDGEGGTLTRVAQVPVPLDDRSLLLTARVTIVPQIEILRALTNWYLLGILGVFVLTLALMLLVIFRSLRPLSTLTESCAAVTSGELQAVSTRGAFGEVRALEETFNDMVRSLREKEVMERKLREAQRLTSLGTLAAGVAHDIRNPLNAIKLLSSHALDHVPGDGNPAGKHLRTIRQEVDRLEEIVSSFMSLARERDLDPQPQNPDAILDECVTLLAKDAESRGVRMLVELRSGGAPLMLDAREWKRAVLNVLLNALEACPTGGRVRLFSRSTPTGYEIEVRDDGPGLDKEALSRVFEPYFTTKPGGTGLGLSITRGIIEAHGGTIDMSGSPGQGCQVLITMPQSTASNA